MELSFRQYIESYAEMGYHLGTDNVFESIPLIISDEDIQTAAQYGKSSLNFLEKLDKIIGMKKMFLMLGPTYNVLINSGLALSKVARHPKKLSSWIQLRDDAVELAKLAAMNPLIAGPIAMGVSNLSGFGDRQELIVIMTKIISSMYFYLSTVVRMMENSKLDQVKKMASVLKDKVDAIMPKSEIHR